MAKTRLRDQAAFFFFFFFKKFVRADQASASPCFSDHAVDAF